MESAELMDAAGFVDTCLVCFSEYNFGSRVAKVFSCGHSACNSCTKRIETTNLVCPLCRNPSLNVQSGSWDDEWIEEEAALRLVHHLFYGPDSSGWRSVHTFGNIREHSGHASEVLAAIQDDLKLDRTQFSIEVFEGQLPGGQGPCRLFKAEGKIGELEIVRIGFERMPEMAQDVTARLLIKDLILMDGQEGSASRIAFEMQLPVGGQMSDPDRRLTDEMYDRPLGLNRRKLVRAFTTLDRHQPSIITFRDADGIATCKVIAGIYSTEAKGVMGGEEEAIELACFGLFRDLMSRKIDLQRLPRHDRHDCTAGECCQSLDALCRAKYWPPPTFVESHRAEGGEERSCYIYRASVGTEVVEGTGFTPEYAKENSAFNLIRKIIENSESSNTNLRSRYNTRDHPTIRDLNAF